MAIRNELSSSDSRVPDMRRVEDNINTISLSVTDQVTDRLLYTRMSSPLLIEDGVLSGCIKGHLDLYYGTSRTSAEVADDFSQLNLPLEEWTLSPTGYPHESEHSWLRLDMVDEDRAVWDDFFPNSCSEYSTCYIITISYAEPSMRTCSG